MRLVFMALAILLYGFAFLTGHIRPYLSINLLIFFKFIITGGFQWAMHMYMPLAPLLYPRWLYAFRTCSKSSRSPFSPDSCGIYPSVIPGSGNSCYLAELAYTQLVALFLQCLLNHFKFPPGPHQDFLAAVFSILTIFFRNSTSCRRYFTSFSMHSRLSFDSADAPSGIDRASFFLRVRFSPCLNPPPPSA